MTEKTIHEKYKLLREPLTAEDIEVRVGTISVKGASLLLYKTARTDAKRLDDIFNGRWKRRHYMDGKGGIVCEISIYDTELKEWVSREDVGSESFTEKEKGAYSDAFKRAGFAWGIGVELYDAPFIFVQCEVIDKKFEVIDNNVFVEIKKKNALLFTNFSSNNPQIPVEKKPEPQKQGNVSVSFETLKEYLLDSPSKERLEAIWKRGEPYITKYTNEQKTEITNIYNNKLAELCTK
jgi:hypothetical protein